MKQSEKLIRHLASLADVTVDGDNPWDIQVHDQRFYDRVIHQGLLGLGESYMDGWWDCQKLDEFFYRVIKANLEQEVKADGRQLFSLFLTKLNLLKRILLNVQNRRRALKSAQSHYDLGNDLFRHMLGENLNVTCAYWKDADNLPDAQLAKLKLICEKLYLKPGMRVLDIGCGWGSFAKFAAENYGVSVVGVTISKEQIALGQELCKGLPIELRFQDYRDVSEQFDRVVSIGMFEHVGYKNYETYMQCAHRCLKDDGLFLLHTIGNNISTLTMNPWIEKYIFPNSLLPSAAQITKNSEGLFALEDWHNFGPDYEKTLLAWHENFNNAWPALSKNYDERFRRMWNYYLLSSAGSFRARYIQLWQVVFSKLGSVNSYVSTR